MNRFRAIPFYGNVKGDASQQDALDASEKIAKEVLPPGYKLTVTGSAAAFREAFTSLIFALILGVVVAYMVLASQFNSFIHPVTVLMALPFSLSGALMALYLGHQSLSLFSMIGLILLMGIVKKKLDSARRLYEPTKGRRLRPPTKPCLKLAPFVCDPS